MHSYPSRQHVHYGTDTDRPIWEDRPTLVDMWLRREHMLLIIAVLLALTAAVIIARLRVPGGVNAAKLGWMSEQWLAEHRASRPR